MAPLLTAAMNKTFSSKRVVASEGDTTQNDNPNRGQRHTTQYTLIIVPRFLLLARTISTSGTLSGKP